MDAAEKWRENHEDRQSQTLAAVTISLRDIVDSSGSPVCYKPSEQALEAVVSVIALFCARQWVRWSYISF
jgi:hypothetical protein